MAVKTQATLVAVFRSTQAASNAVDDLIANGFSSSDIYISSEKPGGKGTGTEVEHHRAGGFIGWIKSIFGKGGHDEEIRYEDLIESGNVLVGVDVRGEDVDKAIDILNDHDPVEVQSPTDTTVSGSRIEPAAISPSTTQGEMRSIPVTEEELKVGKRAVLRGGVRVYSRTVEEPVEENVELQEEHVRVERQPANRPASESDFHAGDEQRIEVAEYAEEPVVSKEARVVEDVRVGKEKTQRTETVRDNVRHTEVDVENLDQSTPAADPRKGAK